MNDPYLFLFGMLSAAALPLVLGIKTLLSSQERIIVPLLRMKLATGDTQAVTYRRGVPRAAPAGPRSYVVAMPAKFTQPERQ